jgi:hypothetical protein
MLRRNDGVECLKFRHAHVAARDPAEHIHGLWIGQTGLPHEFFERIGQNFQQCMSGDILE